MNISKTAKAILILDSDGKRILAKCFEEKIDNRRFERKLFAKTKSPKIRDDILIIDDYLIVHKIISDLHLYVIGNKNENPLLLDSVLNCLIESMNSLLNKNVERQSILNHMSPMILALDEMCDGGLLLEIDSNLIIQRASMKDNTVEPTMAQKLQGATEYMRFPWVRS